MDDTVTKRGAEQKAVEQHCDGAGDRTDGNTATERGQESDRVDSSGAALRQSGGPESDPADSSGEITATGRGTGREAVGYTAIRGRRKDENSGATLKPKRRGRGLEANKSGAVITPSLGIAR